MLATDFELMSLRPSEMPSVLDVAWVGFVSFMLREPDQVKRYRYETGDKWTPGTTAIDRMVDEATGRDIQFIKDFVAWVNPMFWCNDG